MKNFTRLSVFALTFALVANVSGKTASAGLIPSSTPIGSPTGDAAQYCPPPLMFCAFDSGNATR